MYMTVEDCLLANINRLEDNLLYMARENKSYKQVCDNNSAILNQLQNDIINNVFLYTTELPDVHEFNSFEDWKEAALFRPTFDKANKEMQEFIEDTLAEIYQDLKDF